MEAVITVKVEEHKGSLSEGDKYQIKRAVLVAVENGNLDPELLADRCCLAIERINRYGECTWSGGCGATSTTVPE